MSSMGTGNKFDPTQFKVADIYKTKVCPLAKVMRYELKRRGVKKLKVVYSEEIPTKPRTEDVVTCKTVDVFVLVNQLKSVQLKDRYQEVCPLFHLLLG